MGREVMARKDLVVDTDVVSFTGTLLGIVACTGFAAIGLWSLVNLRAGPFLATWPDYGADVFCVWALATVKQCGARFAFGICLAMECIRIGASLLRVSTESVRLLSLGSTLTSVLLFGAMAAFLIGRAWEVIQTAKIESAAGNERR